MNTESPRLSVDGPALADPARVSPWHVIGVTESLAALGVDPAPGVAQMPTVT